MRVINFEMDGESLRLAVLSWKQMKEYLTYNKTLRDAEQEGREKVDWEKHMLDQIVASVKRADPGSQITAEDLMEKYDLMFLNGAYKKIRSESGIITEIPGEAAAPGLAGATT